MQMEMDKQKLKTVRPLVNKVQNFKKDRKLNINIIR